MSYLKPELNKPVRVEWNGEYPQFDSSSKYPKHIYHLTVDGKPIVYEATERMHKEIQQFCNMNGNQFTIVRVPFTKYKADGEIDTVEPWDLPNAPQNAHMYGQSGSQYAKKEKPATKTQEPDWDKINEEKDDKIFKGQAINLGFAEHREKMITDAEVVPRIVQIYHRIKNIDWEAEAKKPMPAKEEPPLPEEPPPFKGDDNLPF